MKVIIESIKYIESRAEGEVEKFSKFIIERQKEISEFESQVELNKKIVKDCNKALELLAKDNGDERSG